jgi:hypothetical protein
MGEIFEVVLRFVTALFYGNSHAYLYPWHIQERSVLGCTKSACQANGGIQCSYFLGLCSLSIIVSKYRTNFSEGSEL